MNAEKTGASGPLPPCDRVEAMDVMRGAALFGVLMVNLICSFRVWQYTYVLGLHTDSGFANHAVDYLRDFFLSGKAMSLFSLLFGAGMAMQMDRMKGLGNAGVPVLVRRMAVLLVFGALHLILLWDGDILSLYAVCGLVLLAFRNASTGVLLRVGLLLMMVNLFFVAESAPPDMVAWREAIGAMSAWYEQGTYTDLVKLRLDMLPHYTWPEAKWSFCPTLGTMLLGMAAWRSGVLQQPRQWRPLLVKVVVAGGSLGGLVTLGVICFRESSDALPGWLTVPTLIGTLMMAMAYGAGLLLYLDGNRNLPLVRHLAAAGRMSLTNYLVQSLLFTTLFYGYGFGLFGRRSTSQAALLGILVYFIQIQVSVWWLGPHRFGPMEWLWRRLSYGRLPQATAPAVTPSQGA